MKKFRLASVMILTLFMSLLLNAQDLTKTTNFNDENIKEQTEHGSPPEILCTTQSVINYQLLQFESSNSLYVELESDAKSQDIQFSEKGKDNWKKVVIGKNATFRIDGLDSDKEYDFQTVNSCGKTVSIFLVKTARDADNPINVSNRLYKILTDRLKTTSTESLQNFLRNETSIAIEERLSFFQQYFLDGAALPDGTNEIPYKAVERGINTDCNCRFIINTSQIASPSYQTATGVVQGQYGYGKIGEKRVDLWPKASLGEEDAKYWWNKGNKGPAKWHTLFTEGYRTTRQQPYGASLDYIGTGSSSFSNQVATLSAILYCDGYDKEEKGSCECDKDLSFAYHYGTKINARAQIITGPYGDKKSYAAVEDIAVAVFRNTATADYVILGAGAANVKAECEQSVNADFWTNLLQVAGSLAPILIAGAATPAQIALLATQLGTFINTNLYTSIGTCTNDALVNNSLIETGTNITQKLKANQGVELIMYSADKMKCGGMRAWFSNTSINSDFYLSAYVKGGAKRGEGTFCCNPKLGLWILASYDGPWDSDELKKQAGKKLYEINPWYLPSDNVLGVVKLPGDFGWVSAPVDKGTDCPIRINPRNSGRSAFSEQSILAPNNQIENITWQDGAEIQVIDAYGRVMFKHQNVGKQEITLNSYLNEHQLLPAQSGIYFVQVTNAKNKRAITTYKIVINK